MADGDRLAKRNDEIWRLHLVVGLSQRAIAERVGISQQRVSQIIDQLAQELPVPDREFLARRAVERAEHLRREMADLYEQAKADPAPRTAASGAVVRDAAGRVVPDRQLQLDAWDRQLKIEERLARALGLDSAVKVETRQEVRHVLEIEDFSDNELK